MSRKAALIILDGWGLGDKSGSDAIHNARTPYIDGLMENRPWSRLETFGEIVGLPDGQMGNSEVGHLNIGAGRTVYQDLLKINRSIDEGDIFRRETIKNLENYCTGKKKPLHLMGLVSDGGVHAHIKHLIALALHFEKMGISVFIHAFTDGRDTDPQKGVSFLRQLRDAFEHTSVSIATVCGRYYAMDRDKRWDRIRLAYDLLVKGEGEACEDLIAAVKQRYQQGETDEFIKPLYNAHLSLKDRTIQPEDAVFFINFRTDRPRQLTEVLNQKDRPENSMKALELYYVTMTEYDDKFEHIRVVYPKKHLSGTLGEYLSNKNLQQLRVAETEKYPHVTFFFNGGREKPFPKEERILVSSPMVATYDLLPEMSAPDITERTLKRLGVPEDAPDFICLNYANADMVGHTGNFKAAVQACEAVDRQLERLATRLLELDYSILIIADHGNADYMVNEDGSPNTAHTTNPVPAVLVSNYFTGVHMRDGNLTDVAPTILSLMELRAGNEMTGSILFE
ncbi:MAG TPA: 2,3-bisphosphoglycerate-independent phosphoglycerate mutase [Saprospiraceae bacterium]|nr:2,3-bisphosphoglycerate-independent phosphoglycerate mutase [Saprospiraceae bacterium]